MSSQEREELSDNDRMERVSHAIINYEYDTINKYSYPQLLISKVTPKQKEKLIKAGLMNHYEQILECAKTNQKVLKNILQYNLDAFNQSDEIPQPKKRKTLLSDNYRVTEMLSAIGKEWSNLGKTKRKKMWSLLLKDLKQNMNARHNVEDSEVRERISNFLAVLG